MIKKIYSIIFVGFIILLYIQFCAFAKEKPRIAVVDFRSETSRAAIKVSPTLIVDKIASDLVKTGRFNVLERVQIEEVLKEQNFPQILKGEEYDYQKLGKLLGAQAIITGTVFYGERSITKSGGGGYGAGQLMAGLIFPPLLLIPPVESRPQIIKVSTYSITVKAVDVETGKIIASEDLLESDLGDIDSMTKRLYIGLLNNYPVKGQIIDRDENNIYVDLGKDVGLTQNDVLEVYKPGKKIMIGTAEGIQVAEEKIGEIEVSNIADTSSICKIILHLTKGDIKKDYIVKLMPAETFDLVELVRRYPKDQTRSAGMGEAFIGQATGPDLVKYNPAGLAQVSDTEINLAWNIHSNSASFKIPNTGEDYSEIKSFYGSYVDNPAYPSEFNGYVPFKKTAMGLHLDVDDIRINHDVFKYDNGGINFGIYSGTAFIPNVMIGGGLTLTDRWVGIHRVVNSVDTSYQFRGNAVGLKGAFLLRPDPKIGIGGVLVLSSNYSGTLKQTGTLPSEGSFSYDGPSNLGLGLSYKPIDRLILNLDLITYFSPSWYDARLGAEFALTKNLAVRAGTYNKLIRVPNFANDPNYPDRYDIKTNIYTAGIGYTTDKLFFDISGEYEILKDLDIVVYPDFNAGSQSRTLLTSYKEARIKLSVGAKF